MRNPHKARSPGSDTDWNTSVVVSLYQWTRVCGLVQGLGGGCILRDVAEVEVWPWRPPL